MEKYNHKHKNSEVKLNKERLLDAWFIFSLCKYIPDLKFKVARDHHSGIDIESICKQLYPLLKTKIDRKWFYHCCEKCDSRIVIMDGNMKLTRKVCSARGEKITNRGHLNEFTCCHHSPLPGRAHCREHDSELDAPTEERMDYGPITRNRRRELGIPFDQLKMDEACRKREAVAVRSSRSRTAGMLYMMRPCGVVLSHIECIHAG